MSKPAGPCIDQAWRQRASVVPCRVDQVQEFLLAHYLHKPPAVVTLCLRVHVDGLPVGAIVFALPPAQTQERYGGVTWELARLFLADSIPANAETWVIGQALRYIKREHPAVCFVVSYADPSVGHEGIIYRAANFTYDGMTDAERLTPRFDFVSVGGGFYDLLGALPQRKFGRAGHIPDDAECERLPRVSKHRYVRQLRKQPSVTP